MSRAPERAIAAPIIEHGAEEAELRAAPPR